MKEDKNSLIIVTVMIINNKECTNPARASKFDMVVRNVCGS